MQMQMVKQALHRRSARLKAAALGSGDTDKANAMMKRIVHISPDGRKACTFSRHTMHLATNTSYAETAAVDAHDRPLGGALCLVPEHSLVGMLDGDALQSARFHDSQHLRQAHKENTKRV